MSSLFGLQIRKKWFVVKKVVQLQVDVHLSRVVASGSRVGLLHARRPADWMTRFGLKCLEKFECEADC